MNIKEYSERALNSARQYWCYLDNHKKGLVTYDVKNIIIDIDDSGHTMLFLTLSDNTKPIKFPDSLFILIDGKTYLEKELNIIYISDDGLQLTIEPRIELIGFLKTLSPTRIKIASDLKFLVQRIGEWYKNHGTDIIHPYKISIPNATAPLKIKDDCIIVTKEQQDAILSIFERPFTYIWGAPGTGKTKCVLSHSIIHCVKNICATAGDKIIVTAPTNNAVDQTLFGIIPTLETQGLDRQKVLRLGTPTASFASKYPDVCENIINSNTIKTLKKELSFIKKDISSIELFENRKKLLHEFKNNLLEYCDMVYNKELLYEEYFGLKLVITVYESVHKQYLTTKESLLKKRSVFSSKLYFFLHNITAKQRKEYKESFLSLSNEISKIEKDISNSEQEISIEKNKLNELFDRIDLIGIEIKKELLLSLCQNSIIDFSQFLLSTKNLNIEDTEHLKTAYFELEKAILSHQPILHFNLSLFELKERLLEKEQLLQAYDASVASFNAATVIAGTIDTLIGKYDLFSSKSNTHIKHVFVDEAAYTPVIKAMIMFSFHAPVTFLGDHMQIPPVCEMSENDLKTNENHDVILWALPATHCGDTFSNTFGSLYEDYENGNEAKFDLIYKSSLNYTHRFGNNLAKLLAKHIYNSNFHGSNETCITVKVLNAKRKPQKGRENICEAQTIAKHLKMQKPSNMAILTPYKVQVELLQKTVPEFTKNIMTVHASQGKEYDTVIFSICDTTNMWFTDSHNKISGGLKVINTAISRAKKELIIVCDEDFWTHQSGQLISELIKIKEPTE